MKKEILAQACQMDPVPVPSSKVHVHTLMLTCGDFRTTFEFLDQHQEQLEQTEKLIEKLKLTTGSDKWK